MPKPIFIGVAGGSASGKTTMVDKIVKAVAPNEVSILRQDWYYKDQDDLGAKEREEINYDHPDAFDWALLLEHLHPLLAGESVQCPTWDYVRHCRSKATITVNSAKVILLEGLLVLHDESLRKLMDIRLFVDADSDIRILRRLKRDITERGRTFDSVTDRYLKDVRPMHEAFIEPTKAFADLVIPYGRLNSVVIEILADLINHRYEQMSKSKPWVR